MKDIKFRAWDKSDKVMANVLEVRFDNEELIKVGYTFDGSDDIEKACLRYPSQVELMQYTGLKDKNGKEVFEGDIVQGFERTGEYSGEGFYYKAIIQWSEERCGWEALTIGDEESYPANDFDFDEIIGNIYENGDLLK